jgi:hypothetical protein
MVGKTKQEIGIKQATIESGFFLKIFPQNIDSLPPDDIALYSTRQNFYVTEVLP